MKRTRSNSLVGSSRSKQIFNKEFADRHRETSHILRLPVELRLALIDKTDHPQSKRALGKYLYDETGDSYYLSYADNQAQELEFNYAWGINPAVQPRPPKPDTSYILKHLYWRDNPLYVVRLMRDRDSEDGSDVSVDDDDGGEAPSIVEMEYGPEELHDTFPHADNMISNYWHKRKRE